MKFLKIAASIIIAISFSACSRSISYNDVMPSSEINQGISLSPQSNQIIKARKYIKNAEFEKAIKILAPLSKQGWTPAQRYLVGIYLYGSSSHKNITKGLFYLEQLSKSDIAAKGLLGTLYYEGDIVKKDTEKAAYWYLKYLASLGDTGNLPDPEVLTHLAILYATGQGVPKKLFISFLMLQEAVNQGYLPAYLIRNTVYWQMNEEERTRLLDTKKLSNY